MFVVKAVSCRLAESQLECLNEFGEMAEEWPLKLELGGCCKVAMGGKVRWVDIGSLADKSVA